MDRYYPEKIRVDMVKEAHIWAKTTDYHGEKPKEHVILTRRPYSFLYIDDVRDLGKKKEYVVRGVVLDIRQIPKYNVKAITPSYISGGFMQNTSAPQFSYNCGCLPTSCQYQYEEDPMDPSNTRILVDCSGEYESKIVELKVSNILDVNDINYEYEAKEDTRLVPGYDKKLTFVEPEKWDDLQPKTDPEVVIGEQYI